LRQTARLLWWAKLVLLLHERQMSSDKTHILFRGSRFLYLSCYWGRSSGRADWGAGLERSVESRVGHECLYSSLCVVLSCVVRGLAASWSLVQGVLPYVDDS
jgi:hypothetical protein